MLRRRDRLAQARQTRKRAQAAAGAEAGGGEPFHHHVYVVLLSEEALSDPWIQRLNPARDPAKPAIYVGMSGLPPEERFANHQAGVKSSRYVKKYGVRLLPELYEYLNPMPYEAALQMEAELAEELRAQGYAVTGGH